MPAFFQKGPKTLISKTVSNTALHWGGVGNGSDYSGLLFWRQQYRCVLAASKWNLDTVRFSFSQSAAVYGNTYGSGEAKTFAPVNALQRDATIQAMKKWSEVSNLNIELSSSPDAELRVAVSSSPATAWAYLPSSSDMAGTSGSGRDTSLRQIWVTTPISPSCMRSVTRSACGIRMKRLRFPGTAKSQVVSKMRCVLAALAHCMGRERVGQLAMHR